MAMAIAMAMAKARMMIQPRRKARKEGDRPLPFSEVLFRFPTLNCHRHRRCHRRRYRCHRRRCRHRRLVIVIPPPLSPFLSQHQRWSCGRKIEKREEKSTSSSLNGSSKRRKRIITASSDSEQ